MKKTLSIVLLAVLLLSAVSPAAGEDFFVMTQTEPEPTPETTPEPTAAPATQEADGDATAGEDDPDATGEEGEYVDDMVVEVDRTAEQRLARFMELYREHHGRHMMAGLHPDGMEDYYFMLPEGVPNTLLSCCELMVPEARKTPLTRTDLNDMFLEAYFYAMSVNDSTGFLHGANLDMLKALDHKVQVKLYEPDWWFVEEFESVTIVISPLAMLDQNDSIVGGTFYAFCLIIGEGRTTMWLCADQDIARDLIFEFLELNPDGTATSHEHKFLMEWYDVAVDHPDRGGEAPQEAEAPAQEAEAVATEAAAATEVAATEAVATETAATEVAATEAVATEAPTEAPKAEATQAASTAASGQGGTIGTRIGAVTVNNDSSVNLRDKPDSSGNVVGQLKAGQNYECVSISAEGWYEVEYRGETGYVSPKLVKFTEYK